MRQRLERSGTFNYQVERTHEEWPDHQLRTLVTASIIAWLKPDSVIDPACGDASVVEAANKVRGVAKMVSLSDISVPNVDHIISRIRTGSLPGFWGAAPVPIEFALSQHWHHDVLVLTEILEHLDDPVAVLRLARGKAKQLVASSPEMRPDQIDTNPEHLWQFDSEGYEDMLNEAGWKGVHKTHLTFRTMYDFQIWVAE